MNLENLHAISDYFEIQNGFAFKSTEFQRTGIPVIRISDIQDEKVILKEAVYYKPSVELEKYEVADGDIVIALSGATTGKFGVYTNSEKAYLNQRVARFRSKQKSSYANRWLYYFFHYKRQEILKEAWGGAQPNISTKKIEEMVIPYPKNLRDIVVNLDKTFSKIESGTKELESAKQKLELYRQSVLNAAIRGKLVSQDPKDEPASVLLEKIQKEKEKLIQTKKIKKEKPLPPIAHDEIPFKIPEGWEWVRLGAIFDESKYGSSSKTNDDSRGVPVLRMGNIIDGELDYNNLKYLPQKHSEFPDLLLGKGDLLFNRTNSVELVGKCAIYQGDLPKASYASYLIGLRFNKNFIVPEYISYCINSPYGRSWVNSVMAQQVGQANVNGTKLANLEIPLPPINEQKKIVEKVKLSLDQIKNTNTIIEDNLNKSQQLKQSILKKAFEGEL